MSELDFTVHSSLAKTQSNTEYSDFDGEFRRHTSATERRHDYQTPWIVYSRN